MKIVKHLQNGKIGIYKRGTNNTYHARFKVDNKWIKKSCKTQDLDEAIAFCENKYQEYMYRLKFHLPIETKLFKDVAELVIKDLQSSLDSGYGKVSYKDYISVLRRYYIPFFWKKNISPTSRRKNSLNSINTVRIDLEEFLQNPP